MLGQSTESHEDPVGQLQFTQRKLQLQESLLSIENEPDTAASVGLFFGGRPVIGSRGIIADFGGKAIEQFQEVVSTRFASLNGPVGARGPIRQRDLTHLMITNVVRGSFGFVLEEVDTGTLVQTSLKTVVGEVTDLIYKVSAPDEETFEAAAETVDDRVLGSLRSFFNLLDDAGATLRMVEDEREFALARDAIERARQRVEGLTIIERDKSMEGVLYILPEGRKFELHPTESEGTIRGAISRECLQSLVGDDGEVRSGIVGTFQTTRLRVREVRVMN